MYKWRFSLMVMCLCFGCQEPSDHRLLEANPTPILKPLEGGLVTWHTWAERDSAVILNKPILLFLYEPRSFWCRDLAQRCFNDPELSREIERITWPVWASVDEQPDVFKRFSLGGVPSVAFLKPNGEWIAGGTYFDPEDLMDLVRRVSFPFANPDRMDALEVQRAELQRRERLQAQKNPRPQIVPAQALLVRVLDSLELAVNHGVDVGPEGALALFEARQSVQGITQWLHTRRDADGAFFLFSHTSDGLIVDREKHLGVNASVLVALARAGSGHTEIEQAGVALGDVLLSSFWVDSLFCAGFAGFDTPQGVPQDRAVYSGWNGLAISGLANLYALTEAPRFKQAALQTMQGVITTFGRQDGFFNHTSKGTSELFLEDQVFVARAALDIFDITGDAKYLQLARHLADGMLAHFGDPSGALRDRQTQEHPLFVVADGWMPSDNGVAGQVFVRLTKQTKALTYAQAARHLLTTVMGPHIDRAASMGSLGRALHLYLSLDDMKSN